MTEQCSPETVPPADLAERIALYLDDKPYDGGHSDAAGANCWELLEEAMEALRGPAQSPAEIWLLAGRLAGAELNYRSAYEQLGGSHIETGRAWDKMRAAGDAIRAINDSAWPVSSTDRGEGA